MASHSEVPKPSLKDKILHPHEAKEQERLHNESKHAHEHVTPHGPGSEAPVTIEKANALPSGGGGKHAVIAGGNENPIVGPGMNLGAHGAL